MTYHDPLLIRETWKIKTTTGNSFGIWTVRRFTSSEATLREDIHDVMRKCGDAIRRLKRLSFEIRVGTV